ncbi:opine metallophore biosynthesis dehydrogenase [Paenibacillus turpanensis]|uniref:opine metallophore biosynthesis dehydrogenase n=1 Tax=Paenibacillus turpanensis TaxID=2689078 RepID=UPI00313317F5
MLFAGAGPAALQTAVLMAKAGCERIGFANRSGSRNDFLRDKLNDAGASITVTVHQQKHAALAGTAKVDCFIDGYAQVADEWDTLFFCTPCEAYLDIVRELNINALLRVKTIVLLSPGLGSAMLVQSQLDPHSRGRIEVISCSTYFAATKPDNPNGSNPWTAATKAVKRRIYIGSSRRNCPGAESIRQLLQSSGIDCRLVNRPLDAEARSITLYVHAPLFINDFSLDVVFGVTETKKYLYKLYPEGPITPQAIETMVDLWKEISELLRKLGAEPINLLQFLNDDNYPVHETSLSRSDVEGFPHFEATRQHYLLYIRYASLQIDPFSIPDSEGRYYDFSAVPFSKAVRAGDGKWVIPRIPYEDYRKLKIVEALAFLLGVNTPAMTRLLELFESRLAASIVQHGEVHVDAGLLEDRKRASMEAEAVMSELSREQSEGLKAST